MTTPSDELDYIYSLFEQIGNDYQKTSIRLIALYTDTIKADKIDASTIARVMSEAGT